MLEHIFHEGLDLRGLGNVGGLKKEAFPPWKVLGILHQLGMRSARNGDLGALFQKEPGRRQTNAAAPAGNEHDFVLDR